MIDRCFNPDCRRKLHYLRDGRIVRLITGKGEDEVIEHYWLCGPCYEEYNFVFPPEGGIALETRLRVTQSREQFSEFHFDEVVIDTEQTKRHRMPKAAESELQDGAAKEPGQRVSTSRSDYAL